MFGRVSMKIKLIAGDSAGTVTAFYVKFISSYKSHPFYFV